MEGCVRIRESKALLSTDARVRQGTGSTRIKTEVHRYIGVLIRTHVLPCADARSENRRYRYGTSDGKFSDACFGNDVARVICSRNIKFGMELLKRCASFYIALQVPGSSMICRREGSSFARADQSADKS